MSDNSVKISNYQLIAYGYCREYEIEYDNIIPKYLVQIISRFIIQYIIYGIGKNRFGQLGISVSNEQQYREKWIRLREMERILQHPSYLFINHTSIMIPCVDGKLYIAGNNVDCRLGIDDGAIKIDTFRSIDELMLSWNIIASHSMGNCHHSFIYINDTFLYRNGYGECWDFCFGNKSTDILSSVELFLDATIRSITCTQSDSYFVTNTNLLYRSICGAKPKLCRKNITHIDGGDDYALLIDTKQSLLIEGQIGRDNNAKGYVRYFQENKIKIKQISAGYKHGAIITTDGDGYMFGGIEYGKCGVNPWIIPFYVLREPCKINLQDERIEKISCGVSHTLLITEYNQVYSFGYNGSHRCSSLMKNYAHITSPYRISKSNELQMNENTLIADVVAAFDSSIIIIDPLRKIKETKQK